MGRLARELEGVLQEKMELLPFDLPDDMGYVEALYEVFFFFVSLEPRVE